MTEKSPEGRAGQDDFEYQTVDGFLIASKDEGVQKLVVVRGPRLVGVESFLGDTYPLRYVSFMHDRQADVVHVRIQPDSDYAVGNSNFQMSTEAMHAVFVQLGLERPGEQPTQ